VFSRWVALVVCAHLSIPCTAIGQVPQTTQRQEIIATLPVLVLGHDGKPLTDLDQNELELYEGKEKRPIESMSRTPESPAEIGFLIDISKSSLGPLHTLKWQRDADPLGELLLTGDRAFVATFTQSGTLMCPLTSDLGQVKASFHTVFTARFPTGLTSLFDAIFWASSEQFSTPSGHKALIIISDMEDNTSQHTLTEALATAQRSGIVIYPISLQVTNPYGDRVAKSIAGKIGGAPDTDYTMNDLKKTFRNIRSNIENTYVVAYKSNSTVPSPVKIRCTRKGARVTAPDERF